MPTILNSRGHYTMDRFTGRDFTVVRHHERITHRISPASENLNDIEGAAVANADMSKVLAHSWAECGPWLSLRPWTLMPLAPPAIQRYGRHSPHWQALIQ
jgi:hypothetical protein